MHDNFYKHIVKRGNSYIILKNNELFGSYSKLTDALYERDRLMKCNWDWDRSLELEETDNIYEKMDLPVFMHESSYICHIPVKYEVFLKREYKGVFRDKSEAQKFASKIGGRIKKRKEQYKVQKYIKGKIKYFGQYPTIEMAQEVRNYLINNDWKWGDRNANSFKRRNKSNSINNKSS